MKKQILTLVLLLLCSTLLQAGSFRSLGMKEGLSSRQVFQVAKDSAGFTWAYTHIGIDRYDGNEIRHYGLGETVESKDHILSSTIMQCHPSGNIWIALKNGKLYSYQKQTDRFCLQINLTEHLSSADLYNILFDREQRLWLCLSTGLYYWDEADERPVLVGLKGHNVHCLIQSTDGTFFAGTSKGVYQLSAPEVAGGAFSERPIPLPEMMHVESLHQWGPKLFIGSFSDGVFVCHLPTGQVRVLNEQIPHVPIRTFAQLKDHSLLIGVDGAGVFQLDPVSEKLLNYYQTDPDDAQSLNGNTVSDICVDWRGGVWVSTSTNGISYLDPAMPDVRRMKHEQNNANSLKSDHINVLLQDSEGDCWYGTNNGVSLYQPRLHKWTHFLDATGHSSKVVLALAEDSKGNIWAGGYGIGLYSIQKRTGHVQKQIKRTGSSPKGISTDYIYAIHADADYLWLGGIEGELTRYHLPTETYTYYPINCVGDIKSSKDGSLLIAGCDGLAFFDKQTGEARWHRKFGEISLRYPIRCLLQSSSGDIWLATDGEGLICFNPDKKESRFYTTTDGLSSNSINSIVEDDEGRIWFSTEKELYSLDRTKRNLISANDLLNIAWGYYNPAAALKLTNGQLVFGTAEGAVVFSPSLNLGEHDPIKLIWTDFKLFYELVKAGQEGSPLITNLDDTRLLSLKHNQNSFSISFSVINFVASHRIGYEYQLKGHDKQWLQFSTIGSISYMNLSPGTYTFCLRAFDKYSGRQLDERKLEIVINRPYWLSQWAWGVYLALALLFVYLSMQYRRHKRNEERIKEKIHSFISIAHDIRTPVTLIKAPLSELEAQQELSEASKKMVAVAVKNVEKLLTMIGQLLDLQKTELRAELLQVSSYNIKAYLEEKIAEFHWASMQKGVALHLEVATDMPEVWIDRKKMDHIVDNLLSNALKYTENGTILLSAKHLRKRWSIEVRDTGIGIPKEEQDSIFHDYYRARNAMNFAETGSGIGLMITRRLVKQHHGSISFSSVEGRGTIFTVDFPLKINSAAIVRPFKENRQPSATSNLSQDIIKEATKNTLLLAEDDPDMREYLTQSLSSEYKVVAVSDGGKALEMAKEINPDLIISDIVMPVLEGDELCRILKSSIDTSHIPIILLTALSERENIIFGLEAGANDYIIKPFDLAVLKVRIRNVLKNRQQLRDSLLSTDVQTEEIDYTSQLDKEFMDRVMVITKEEMANCDFSITDFCSKLCMSRTSAFNKLKTLTGQGPNDFIRIVRLNKAKELLLTRRYTISEVASMVGFSDPKYFSTCFKKQFEISPSKV